jgi:class 3 adenylate cyclase
LPEIVLRHDREKPWREWLSGTVLFADVSGFTPMSETLSVLGAEGAELLTGILNRYFAAMIGIVGAHGGQVMKFGGDALQCFFPEAGSWRGGNILRENLKQSSGPSAGRKPEAGENHVAAPFGVRPDSPMENRGNTAQAEACGSSLAFL